MQQHNYLLRANQFFGITMLLSRSVSNIPPGTKKAGQANFRCFRFSLSIGRKISVTTLF